MMIILGILLAIAVGITLGLVGSGGSILTVPIFVYIMGVDPVLATTYSLFAIGVTSFLGGVRGFITRTVDIKKVLTFGVPSLLMVYITRMFILPLVPDVLIIGPYAIHQNNALMVLFALVMLGASVSMIIRHDERVEYKSEREVSGGEITAAGGAVGLVTGLVGTGGGFLIIPALVNFFRMPIKRAVSTSLVIIAVNSFFGLLGDLEKFHVVDWQVLLSYTVTVIAGMFAGFSISKGVDGSRLKVIFGYLVLFVGIYILLAEFLLQ
ncbi:sulfite exporter TauE/SafE family protein [Sphingobacterium olei]|nr:sulfite exporter TauE/SafE family protein [Sphingobacterium olei]